MTPKEEYIKEIQKLPFPQNVFTEINYIKWLENKVSELHEPQILTWIKTMFEHADMEVLTLAQAK